MHHNHVPTTIQHYEPVAIEITLSFWMVAYAIYHSKNYFKNDVIGHDVSSNESLLKAYTQIYQRGYNNPILSSNRRNPIACQLLDPSYTFHMDPIMIFARAYLMYPSILLWIKFTYHLNLSYDEIPTFKKFNVACDNIDASC